MQGRTIALKSYTCFEITVFMQVCEHFKMCAHGHVMRSTVSSGRQAGITPNLLIIPICGRLPLLQLFYMSLVH